MSVVPHAFLKLSLATMILFACGGDAFAITCFNGTVRGGKCVCMPSAKKVQIGPSAWRCMRPKATPAAGSRHYPGVIGRFSQGDGFVPRKKKLEARPLPAVRIIREDWRHERW